MQMNSGNPFSNRRTRSRWAAIAGLGLAASTLWAADTNAPSTAATNAPANLTTNAPEAGARAPATTTNAPAPTTEAKAAPALTPEQLFEGGTNTYANWIDFSTGGYITHGNNAQFEQRQRSWDGPFGGISDFHYQRNLGKDTTLSADGHALLDQHDYQLKFNVVRPQTGFVRFSYNEFRTWYNGDGGFYPPTGQFYPLSSDALTLDRGEISFEAGLTMEKLPKITFKYTHTFRDGEKSSTSWGIVHPAVGVAQGLSPSFWDINEHSDSFQLDATHHIKATDFGLGLRYENGKLDNALKIDQGAGEPFEQKITDRQGTTYDLFNVHAFTETWIKQNLMFSSGYSFSDLDNNFTGSQIYGDDFDVRYMPNPANGLGYTNLLGGSRIREYVMNLNLMAKPWKTFTIVPSIRVQKEDTHADAVGYETLQAYAAPQFNGTSDQGILDVRERLDLNYTGITNWVFNARGEWTEGEGTLNADGGLIPVNGIGLPPIQQRTDDRRFFQKYSLGAKWYPDRRVSFSAGGYYKVNNYDYNNLVDSTANNSGDRYPAYLVMQNFETYDGNVGVTFRPRQNLSVVTRYEYQWSTIHTEPDPVSGLGKAESATMTSHILGVNLSWSPWSRLYLQPGFNYVVSETKTPVSDYTPATLSAAPILAAQNNYWTVNFNSGFVVDEKTDLNVNYFYYRANDYTDNSTVGVPYGAGAEEHGVTASLVRRLSQNVRLTITYGYSHYDDQPSGGNYNYDAHLLYASLRYRF